MVQNQGLQVSHSVLLYTKNPPSHFNFYISLLMIIIYSSFIVITEKQNLDSCITFFFLINPILLHVYSYIQLIMITLNRFSLNYFLSMQPIQFNFSVSYRFIYVCVFLTHCPINRGHGRKDKGQIPILKKHIKVCLIQGWCRLSCFSR